MFGDCGYNRNGIAHRIVVGWSQRATQRGVIRRASTIEVRLRGRSGQGQVTAPYLFVAVLLGEGCYPASARSLRVPVRFPSNIASNCGWNPRWVCRPGQYHYPESAAIKGIPSLVAGAADIPTSPDLEAQNAPVVAIACFAKGKMAGAVLGSKRPLIAASRSDPRQARQVRMAPGALSRL
jgi:hypothetical protein